jgi:hypothetical protein
MLTETWRKLVVGPGNIIGINRDFFMEISWRPFMFGDMNMHYFFNSKDVGDIISKIYLI